MSIGYTVVITRPVEHAEELRVELQRHSIETFSLPLFSFRDLESMPAQEQAVRDVLALPNGLCVFSSREGVTAFARRFMPQGRGAATPMNCAVAAVGERTASTVRELLGRKVDVVPEKSSAAALAAMIIERFSAQTPIALIAGRDGRSELIEQLTTARYQVFKIELYERVTAPASAAVMSDILSLPAARTIWIFFSPSAVTGALALGAKIQARLRESPLLAIGATTAEALRMRELSVAIQSEAQDVAGVVNAVQQFCSRVG